MKVEVNSMVDVIKLSYSRATPPPANRYKRKTVTGGHGLEVNEAGNFYRSDHRVLPTGLHLHLIHPGKDYCGPVWPQFGSNGMSGLKIGSYLKDPEAHRETGKRIICYDRLAAELVAYEFLGRPPGGWDVTAVVHRDGDQGNAAVDNLRYVQDPVQLEARRRHETMSLMESDIPAKKLKSWSDPSDHVQHSRNEGLAALPDYLPPRHRMVSPPPTKVPHWDASYNAS